MPIHYTALLPAVLSIFLFNSVDAHAFQGKGKGKGMGKKKMMEAKAPYEHYEQKGLFKTSLIAKFPDGFTCEGVASPYGSKTRYDGSKRNNSHYGYHNGLDITLKTGTPLLAMADGEVAHAGTGGQLVGNFIWIRYAPKDTGFSSYVFSRYQHLDEPPKLSAGTPVKKGEVVALSGKTGTTGGIFGSKGYPHLHMNLLIGDSETYMVKGSMLGPKSMTYFDPIGLFINPPPAQLDNHLLVNRSEKTVPISIKTSDGKFIPDDSKVVWPVACDPN